MTEEFIRPEVGMCWRRTNSDRVCKATIVKDNMVRFALIDGSTGLTTGEGASTIRGWREELDNGGLEILKYPMYNTDADRFNALEKFLRIPGCQVRPPKLTDGYWEMQTIGYGEFDLVRGKTLREATDNLILQNHKSTHERAHS